MGHSLVQGLSWKSRDSKLPIFIPFKIRACLCGLLWRHFIVHYNGTTKFTRILGETLSVVFQLNLNTRMYIISGIAHNSMCPKMAECLMARWVRAWEAVNVPCRVKMREFKPRWTEIRVCRPVCFHVRVVHTKLSYCHFQVQRWIPSRSSPHGLDSVWHWTEELRRDSTSTDGE